MSSRFGLLAIAAVLGAAGYAALHSVPPPERDGSTPIAAESPPNQVPLPPMPGVALDGDQQPEALPPGHPPIGGPRASGTFVDGAPVAPPSADEAPAITWQPPSAWKTAPNPSSMRLATYRVPHVGADTEDAEVSVTRAGGSVDANIERWIGQFDKAGKEDRSDRRVKGFKVSQVEVNGTFAGGSMTPGSASTARPGWALLGAVVETRGTSYFFKMTGPAATVHAARASFLALIDSITPP